MQQRFRVRASKSEKFTPPCVSLMLDMYVKPAFSQDVCLVELIPQNPSLLYRPGGRTPKISTGIDQKTSRMSTHSGKLPETTGSFQHSTAAPGQRKPTSRLRSASKQPNPTQHSALPTQHQSPSLVGGYPKAGSRHARAPSTPPCARPFLYLTEP